MRFPEFDEWYDKLTDDEIINVENNYDGDYVQAYNDEISYYADMAYDQMKDDMLTERSA